MKPSQHSIPVNGIDLVWFDWSGGSPDDHPVLVFAHATGFHARMFDAIIEHFPEHRCIAIDLRGHGRSGGGPVEHWQQFADDVASLLAHLEIEGAIGVGHSMGAHTLLQTAADNPSFFNRLVLFDPVILLPEYYTPEALAQTSSEPHPTSRRKRDFASVEEMMERFRERTPYNLFDPRVFADYCQYGLIKTANGEGFELACKPEMEASVYDSSRSNRHIHETASKLETPTLIVRAKPTERMDFTGSPTWPKLASTMPNGVDLPRPDMTHFHPFQDPEDAARIIADWIELR